MRVDGRRVDQLRPVKLRRGAARYAEGSALIEMGGTRVLCTASVEPRTAQHLKDTGKGWVTAEYGMLPRATHTRTPRARAASGGRSQEIQRLIGRSLRAITDLEALGERTIILDCDVMQADGGTRTAAITGAYVALHEACRRLLRSREITRWPLRDSVAAVSVGLVDGRPCLDLCYEEDSNAGVDMNIVMTGGGRFVELQGTAERGDFTERELSALIALGRRGTRELTRIQRRLCRPPA